MPAFQQQNTRANSGGAMGGLGWDGRVHPFISTDFLICLNPSTKRTFEGVGMVNVVVVRC